MRRDRGREAAEVRPAWGATGPLGHLHDRGEWLLLVELDNPLAHDLWRLLGWVPPRSESGLGWLVGRCYVREVRRVARRLNIELHLVDETAAALAGVG